MDNNHDIWVIAEHDENGLRQCTHEILTEAYRLADELCGRCCLVLIGHNLHELADSLTAYDIDICYLVEHPLLKQYRTESVISALTQLIKEFSHPSPLLILVSATPNGQDFAPRLAMRLEFDMISNCVMVKTEPDNDVGMDKEIPQKPHFYFIKPTHQDKIYTTLTCLADSPILATLRPGAISVDLQNNKKNVKPQFIKFIPQLNNDSECVQILQEIPGDAKTIDLREAEMIIAGGRGVENISGWQLIEQFADILGASIGGSRMIMDMGFIGRERVIGQTGKNVHPKLYVAAGISGSDFHLRAVETEHLIAINKDRAAPIFKICKLGILGNLHEILPLTIQKLKKLQSKNK